MLEVHDAVAGVAVDRILRECLRIRTHRGGVASGAAVGELGLVPRAVLLLNGELAVAGFLEIPVMSARTEGELVVRPLLLLDREIVCVLAPDGTDVVAMAKQTLIAGDELGDRRPLRRQ